MRIFGGYVSVFLFVSYSVNVGATYLLELGGHNSQHGTGVVSL